MDWNVAKIGTRFPEPAQAIGRSIPSPPPIGCVLDLPGLPGAGSKIYDRSPYGNVGTISGAVWVRTPGGLWCLSFDGTDDRVNCGLVAGATTAITAEAWVFLNPPYTGGYGTIFGSLNGSDSNRILAMDAGHIRAMITIGGTEQSVFFYSLPALQWHHIVYRYDGANEVIFANTIKGADYPKTGTFATGTSALLLGRRSDDVYPFKGLIALPRIFNRALSALEIANHFNREKPLFGV